MRVLLPREERTDHKPDAPARGTLAQARSASEGIASPRSRFGLVLPVVLWLAWCSLLGAAAPPPAWLVSDERVALHAKAQELDNAGLQAYGAGQLAGAAKAFTRALEIRRRLYPLEQFPDGHPALARSLNNLAFLFQVQGKLAEAEPLFREALRMRRLQYRGDHPELVIGLSNLSSVLRERGKLTEAEGLARDALKMSQRLYKGDHPDVAHGLNNLATVLRDQGKLAEAEPLLRDAAKMARGLYKGDHPVVASSLNNLAFVLRDEGKLAEAEDLFRDALKMDQRLYKGDHPDLAVSLNNLALLLREQGKLVEAEQLHRDSLKMFRRLVPGDHPYLAITLNNVAAVLQEQGKLAEAERLLRDVVKMQERLHKGGHVSQAGSLNNLAVVLRDQGKWTEAESVSRAALQMLRRLHKGDHPQLVGILTNLAGVLEDQNKREEAELLYREAFATRQRLSRGDHIQKAICLNNLAGVLRAEGKLEEAETHYRTALEMNERLYKGDHPLRARSLNNLAVVLHLRGKSAEAEKVYRDALAMYQRLDMGDDRTRALCLDNLGFVLYAQGRYAEAEQLYRDALRMQGRLAVAYARLKSEGEALTLLASQFPGRDHLLSTLRVRASNAAAVYAEVWQSKGAVARVFEQRALAARAATSSPRATALLNQLADQRRQRSHLILAPAPRDPATRGKRDADLARLAERIAALEADLRILMPVAQRSETLAQATLADLQKVLPADAVFVDLLHYVHIEQDRKTPGLKGRKSTSCFGAFVLTRERVIWLDLGPAGPIAEAVERWREALTTPPFRPAEDLAARVRELCWAKVRKELPKGIRVVYLCPDLALARLPWSALPGDRPGTLVLEEFAVAVVPHGPFLLDHLKPAGDRPTRPSRLLAVGGVAYGEEPVAPGPDPKLLAARSSAALKPDQKPVWADLPFAAAEAKELAVRARRSGLETTLLSGREASAERVLTELSRSRVAHLATHGFFADPSFRSSVLQADPELFLASRRGERVGAGALSPLVLSGLVFAGANRDGTAGRGLLTGEGLVDRDLSGLELAVLSACETGLGDTAGGEGVFGLQRALHVAGCRDVVASLWKVPDAATAALMGEFYRALWEEKLPPVLALQKAQLAVYRADPKQFRELAVRGFGVGDRDLDAARVIRSAPVREDGRNPAVLWAAFTLSGPGR